jgi:hypothetical protein
MTVIVVDDEDYQRQSLSLEGDLRKMAFCFLLILLRTHLQD